MAGFDCWAPYYDLIHQGLPGDVEFYVGQGIRRGGEALEIGCGSGRIALPLAMSGVNVTGVDNSAQMLALCRARKRKIGATPGKLKLLKRDMAGFDLGATFDYIIMAYRTFMHMLTPEAQHNCLTTIHRHLAEDGLFIMDTWLPRLAALRGLHGLEALRPAGRIEIPDTSRCMVHYHSSRYDEGQQLLSEEHLLQEVDKSGTVLSTVTLPLLRAWTTPRELHNLLRLCGFESHAVFGDFDCNPINASSDEMIWVLKKA